MPDNIEERTVYIHCNERNAGTALAIENIKLITGNGRSLGSLLIKLHRRLVDEIEGRHSGHADRTNISSILCSHTYPTEYINVRFNAI